MNFWRLIVKRPASTPEIFDLRKKSRLTLGDDGSNDICVLSTAVPSRLPFIQAKSNKVVLKLTNEILPSIVGRVVTKKTWSTKLYEGKDFDVFNDIEFSIGDVVIELKRIEAFSLAPYQELTDPRERQDWIRSWRYSSAAYAIIFALTLLVGWLNTFFKTPELVATKIAVAEAEKIFKKPEIKTPDPIQIQEPDQPKLVEKTDQMKKVQKLAEGLLEKSTVARGNPRKAPVPARSSGRKGAPVSKPVTSMGLLAIQGTAGPSRVSLDVAQPQVLSKTKSLNKSLGLGKGDFGIGTGKGDEPQQIAMLGSLSGSSYRGEIGARVGNAKRPAIQLAKREVEIRGGLDAAVIRQIIEERLSEIRYCYETALLKHQNLSGKISTQWTILPDGSVSQLQSASEEISQEILHPCVKQQITKWRFPQPKGGGIVKVKYPFLFNPIGS